MSRTTITVGVIASLLTASVVYAAVTIIDGVKYPVRGRFVIVRNTDPIPVTGIVTVTTSQIEFLGFTTQRVDAVSGLGTLHAPCKSEFGTSARTCIYPSEIFESASQPSLPSASVAWRSDVSRRYKCLRPGSRVRCARSHRAHHLRAARIPRPAARAAPSRSCTPRRTHPGHVAQVWSA